MRNPADTALKAASLFVAAAILIGVPSLALVRVWNDSVDGTIMTSEQVEHGTRYVLRDRRGMTFEYGGGGSGLATELKAGDRVHKEAGSFQYWVDGVGTKGRWPSDFIPIFLGVGLLVGALITIVRSK